MRVLVACEFSGRVRDAYARRGHDAWSCDLLPTEAPGNHIQGDVLDLLDDGWDLMIAFPPCTYLTKAGSPHWHTEKWKRNQPKALDFVCKLLNCGIPQIALENPIGIINTRIRKCDQKIHPYMFGHPFLKATCLWLKNLPKLKPTNIVPADVSYVETCHGKHRAHLRSITFEGVAEAMAEQWCQPYVTGFGLQVQTRRVR